MKNVLVTGVAGFIGFHVANRLIKDGYNVVGIDNLNNYYSPELKESRLNLLGISVQNLKKDEIVSSSSFNNFKFALITICDKLSVLELFRNERFDIVINLAAQAGVRYSVENPYVYVESNVSGFLNILEGCRTHNVGHLVYASTSSVYGLNGTMPYSTHNGTNHPVSLYAATKKANELMAHSYSHLYGIPTTGLRFFTVYGPWGRPDMALFLFTDAMLNGKPINIYNNGQLSRDFTYIDDIVEGITGVMNNIPNSSSEWDNKTADPSSSSAPFRIFNIGNSKPVKLMEYVDAIEKATGIKAVKNYLPMQPGDVLNTYADISDLHETIGYEPKIEVEEGVANFVKWFREYYSK